MELSRRMVPAAILLLFLLLISTGMGPTVVEGRTCESPSTKFRGLCLIERNCAGVCQTEGFPGGDCRGVRRRCFCTRPC